MPSAPGSSTDISPTWIAQTILTDEMLARFAKRAPQYDRDNVFFSDDFDELAAGRILATRDSGGTGRRGAVAGRRRAAAAPPRLLRRADGARGQHAPVLDRHRRRSLARRRSVTAMAARGRRGWRGVRCRARRERQRHSGAALDDEGRARRRRLSVHGPQVVRQPLSGVDVSRHSTAWTPPIRRKPKVVHAFMPRDTEGYRIEQTWDVLGHAGHAERRHDPRRRVRARSLRRCGSCPPAPPASTRSCSGSSPGRSSGSATSTTGSRGGRST